MSRAPFTIFKYKYTDPKTGKCGYKLAARYVNGDGLLIKTKTLQSLTTKKAILEAQKIMESGIGLLNENPLVIDILTEHWKADSAYAKKKARKGKKLSEMYIYTNALTVKKHLTKPLEGIHVSKLTIGFMEQLIDRLEREGNSLDTINRVLDSIQIPLRVWAKENKTPYPLEYFDGYSEVRAKEHGTLSIEEIQSIIALENESPRVKLAVLLGTL